MQILFGNLSGYLDRSRRNIQARAKGMHGGFFGSMLMLLAALFFAVNSLIIKLTASMLSPWQIGFARFLIGLIFTVIAARTWRRSIWGQHRFLLTLRGFAGTVSFIFVILSIQMVPLSQATVLFFLFPMFAAIHGLWLNRDPVPFVDWGFIFLGFCGAILILWSGTLSIGLQWGHVFALIGAMTAGFAVASVRKLRATNSPFTIYFYFCLVGAPVCLAPMLGYHQWQLPGTVPVLALVLTAFLGLVGQLLMNEGFKDVPAHTGGMLLSTQVIFAAVAGVLFFHEEMTWRLFLGSALVLASGCLLSFPKKTVHPDQALTPKQAPDYKTGQSSVS